MDTNGQTIVISGGTARAIYSEDLRPVMAKMGAVTITRASFVEPGSAYGCAADRWVADMRASGGPILLGPTGEGFETRDAALAAELVWLREERGL